MEKLEKEIQDLGLSADDLIMLCKKTVDNDSCKSCLHNCLLDKILSFCYSDNSFMARNTIVLKEGNKFYARVIKKTSTPQPGTIILEVESKDDDFLVVHNSNSCADPNVNDRSFSEVYALKNIVLFRLWNGVSSAFSSNQFSQWIHGFLLSLSNFFKRYNYPFQDIESLFFKSIVEQLENKGLGGFEFYSSIDKDLKIESNVKYYMIFDDHSVAIT